MPATVMRFLLLCAVALWSAACASRPAAVRPPPPAAAAFVPVAAEGRNPSDAPQIHARACIMIDARSGTTLFEKDADALLPVASTQKLLTAMLVANGGSLDQHVCIAPSDTFVEPSKLGLRPGEIYTRRQLLNAMMVKSSNDAAACLARDHSGSIAGFAARMNQRALELGAHASFFVNPHGLPASGQHSSARDMARIAFAAYRDPDLRQMMRQRTYAFRYASGRVATLEATNKLLGRSPAFTGMKTGYTAAAGRCLVTSADVSGGGVIVVQLGSNTRNVFDDAERLVRWQAGRRGFFASAGY